MPRLGVILQDEHALRAARPSRPAPAEEAADDEAVDPVQLVVLRSTLLNPPRAAAARALAEQVRSVHPNAVVVPYVWHLVSHGESDGLREAGTRTLPGEARRFGHLQDTPEAQAAWEVSLRCAKEMGSDTVILRTPPSFTPGTINQARLAAFAEARAAEGLRVVWELDGLWEPATTLALARKLNIDTLVPAFEGTGRPVPQSYERRWLRVDSAGATERLRGALAESLVFALANADALEDATILFAGGRAHANLRAFARSLDAADL
ncbi:hypothetical protein [Nannocystis pusilla]|uniref:Uncharacterized protein n=1 Tax=Nannocystis pusilla TaxID=889268 RepID=A0ABS7U500_9BACT|nr:hypothetical protein [Nannocystis pusilla]MBZ5715491.1 hypothetical protein [Nannocystis pusilla]